MKERLLLIMRGKDSEGTDVGSWMVMRRVLQKERELILIAKDSRLSSSEYPKWRALGGVRAMSHNRGYSQLSLVSVVGLCIGKDSNAVKAFPASSHAVNECRNLSLALSNETHHKRVSRMYWLMKERRSRPGSRYSWSSTAADVK